MVGKPRYSDEYHVYERERRRRERAAKKKQQKEAEKK